MINCRKCGIELAEGENWWPSHAKTGRRICIECSKSRARRYRTEHPERERERSRQWKEANPEYNRQWYETNPEYHRQWREAHPDKVRESNRRNRAKYREERVEYTRQWRKANPKYAHQWHAEHRAERAEQHRQWAKANPEKIREKTRRYRAMKNDATIELVDEAAIYERDKRCVYCGATEDLTLDHIVALTNGGPHCEDNLVVACRRCNCSKGAKSLIEWLWFKTLIV